MYLVLLFSIVRPSAPCPGLRLVNTSSVWTRVGEPSSGVTSETANQLRGHNAPHLNKRTELGAVTGKVSGDWTKGTKLVYLLLLMLAGG